MVPRMWQKYSQMSCWYYPMWRWNFQMWEKNESTTECDKSMVRCDIGNFVIYICRLLGNLVGLDWVEYTYM